MYRKLALVAALTVVSMPVMAGTPGLDARQQNQKDRIVQGVRSGELTRPETRRMVAGEVRLARNEARAKSDGVVTGKERARLHNQANNMSKRIYRQKHDPQSR